MHHSRWHRSLAAREHQSPGGSRTGAWPPSVGHRAVSHGVPLDLGGDKTPRFLSSAGAAAHPNLALRGLRFSLAERQTFDVQLRAIVRVAQGRDVRVLFPMVIGGHALGEAGAALDNVVSELGAQRRPLVGAMIETPAVLFSLDEVLDRADFLAIGTNDLSQYMLALDRDIADLSDKCTPWHPLVLRAIDQVIKSAAVRECPVSICGEDAGDPAFACLLVGLGARELSLSAARSAGVRHALRSVRCSDLKEFAQLALRCGNPAEVRQLATRFVPQSA